MEKTDKKEKIKELLKQAEEGTKAVFESENYKNYLLTMSKFHNYSARNILLIALQRPDATLVAGYKAWNTKFKRHVMHGEKGIQIVGFSERQVKIKSRVKDEKGNFIFEEDGKPLLQEETVKVPYFFPATVFDVSQTDGEPIPSLATELTEKVEAYDALLNTLLAVSPYPVSFEEIQGGAKGYCSPSNMKIAVQQGMSESQTIKTLIHEITHADLHSGIFDEKDRRTKEVEAESTAFVVCSYLGIDSSEYSFPYLAAWSSNRELDELSRSLDTIQKQAHSLIGKIDERLSELKDKEMQQPQKLFSEVKAAAIEKAAIRNNEKTAPLLSGKEREVEK